jgi:catalase
MRFDHERIPERVVHARGTAAFGTFKLFESAEDVTTAGVLTDTSRETPLFLRFSTVQGSKGSADTVRDVRGFAIKMYTAEGNWDIVGNNIPVFFIQDAIKFPDVVHSVKPEPHNEVPQGQSAHNNFWDFVYMHSETTHMNYWVSWSPCCLITSRIQYRGINANGLNSKCLIGLFPDPTG